LVTTAQRSDAWAGLYDCLSLAFAYPNDRLYADLKSGIFVQSVRRYMAIIPAGETLQQPFESLQRAAEACGGARDVRELESVYISLFEANRAEAPLHLYGYLYDQRRTSRIEAMQRLQDTYRQFGLELQHGHGTENADHLTIQLEFLAYLYRLRHKALLENREMSTAIGKGIEAFRAQLGWVSEFVAQLGDRELAQAFYAPLGRFVVALLAAPDNS
jgi:nitrate reductase assembly molybdenum cofactor insertion protein NarJ